MKEVLVWLLISVSEGTYNQASVVEYLPSEAECRSLMKAFGELNRHISLSCVQAAILVKE